MKGSLPWGWIALAAFVLLLPGPAGRLLLDLLGGFTLLLLLLPLLAAAAGFVVWQVVRRRLRSCPSCGFRSLALDICPACGAVFSEGTADAAAATITVEATSVCETPPSPS